MLFVLVVWLAQNLFFRKKNIYLIVLDDITDASVPMFIA